MKKISSASPSKVRERCPIVRQELARLAAEREQADRKQPLRMKRIRHGRAA